MFLQNFLLAVNSSSRYKPRTKTVTPDPKTEGELHFAINKEKPNTILLPTKIAKKLDQIPNVQ